MTNKIEIETRKEILGEYKPIGTCWTGQEVVAYRITAEQVVYCATDEREGYKHSDSSTVSEGLAFLEDYKEFFSKPIGVMPDPSLKRGDWTSTIMAFKPGMLEELRLIGWHNARYGDDRGVTNKTLWEPKPYSALERGEEFVALEVHSAAHEVFDLEGVPHAVMQTFGYIGENMDNAHWKLVPVVRVLLERDDIVLFENGGERKRYGDDKPDDDPRKWVGNIPGYNAERGRDKCISFHWTPSREDFIKAYNRGREGSCGYYCTHKTKSGAIALDLFGIAHLRKESKEDY